MPNWTNNAFTGKKEILKKYINAKGDFDFNLVIKMPEELSITSGSVEDEAIIYYYSKRFTLPIKDYVSRVNRITRNTGLFGHNYDEDAIQQKIEAMEKSFKAAKANKEKGIYYAEEFADTDLLYQMGETYANNFHKYGYTTWYDWCCDRWGVKWNACDCSVEEDGDLMTIHFDTAWNTPYAVINSIVGSHPNEEFTLVYEDEDYDGVHTVNFNSDGTFEEKVEDPYGWLNDNEELVA